MDRTLRQIICILVELAYGGDGNGTCGGVGVVLVLDGDEATELGREGLELPRLRRWGRARVPAVRRPVVLLPPPLPFPGISSFSSSAAAVCSVQLERNCTWAFAAQKKMDMGLWAHAGIRSMTA
jgi:hypothetical protein